jgi:hypothetical protein
MIPKHTPGPWRYEAGGGHAYNRIVGADSVQVSGWPEPINGVSNASYSDRICENLGDINLPGPAANARLIAAAPEMYEALCAALPLLEFEVETRGDSDSDYEFPARSALDAVRAAIAKATGERS